MTPLASRTLLVLATCVAMSVSGVKAAHNRGARQTAPTPPLISQRSDPELKGLRALGLVVEDLGPQTAACGLRQEAIEATATKSLTSVGLKVLRNADEDTYLYIHIVTTSVSTGLCVSRFDAFLYSYTTARLSYQDTPALLQVSLLHQGGIAGGSAAVHADAVMKNIKTYVDEFAARIRDANR